MRIIFCFTFFWISVLSVFAGDNEYVSANSLVATYITNANSLLKSNPSGCISWAEKAIEESKINGNKHDLGQSLYLKALALENLRQYANAVKFFQESLKVAEDFKLLELEMNALNKLSTLFAKTGDYKSAVLYAKLLHDRKDSNALYHQRILTKILPGKTDLQKSETKMKQLLADNSELDNNLRDNLKLIENQGNWIFIIVVGYGLVFLSFVVFKRQNRLILLKNHALTDQMHTLEKGKMELDHNRYKAEESERLKTSFLANISHEIRTPLNAIVSFSGFLRQKDKRQSERKRYIKVIHQYSESLLSLINEIFEVARIESGEIKQEPESVNLNEFLEKIHIQYCTDNKKAIKKGLKLILKLQPKESICYIKTYPDRLKNVVLHLIENAMKYSENGYIELGYVIKESFVEFYVMDDGKGFSNKKIDDIFERFKSTDDFPRTESGPLGLGLTISKNFIDSMGGNIWVKSNAEKGSTFFFTLPVQLKS